MTRIPRQANTRWRKSSHSTNEDGACVEVAALPAAVAIRDSKDPGGPHLTVSAEGFAAFVKGVTPAG